MISKITKDILTGVDNQTFDNGRVMCVLSFIVYFFMAGYGVIQSHNWNPLDFASGVGTMAVGFGVNLSLKKSTEPTP